MTKVIIAHRVTSRSGEVHEGGDVVEVDGALARKLIYTGQARLAPAIEEQPKTAKAKTTRRAKKVGTNNE